MIKALVVKTDIKSVSEGTLTCKILFQVLQYIVCKETAFVIHLYYIYIQSDDVAEKVNKGIPNNRLYRPERRLLFRYQIHIYF